MVLMGLNRTDAEIFVRGEALPAATPVVEVLSDCLIAVRLFIACLRQWRFAPMGGPVGLDMPGVDVVRRWMGIDESPQLLDDLRTLEAEALICIKAAQ